MLDQKNDLDMVFLDLLGQIAGSLAEIANFMAPAAPNWTHDLAAFPTFDFQSIGATVVKADDFGPATVEWRGRTYTRRSPENKFGAAIWFSRPAGKTEDGSVRYERLITFRPTADAEPISRQAETAVRKAAQDPHPPAAPAKPAQAAPPRPPVSAGPNWDDLKSATEDPVVQSALAKAQNSRGAPDPAAELAEELAARAAFERQHQAPPSANTALSNALDQAAASDHAALMATMTGLARTATNQIAAAAIVKSASGQINGPHAEKALNSAISALRKMQ